MQHYINLLLANAPILCNLKIPEKLLLLRFQKVQNGNMSDMGQSTHQRCSVKKVFLKMLQISQENACVGVPFK